MGRFETRQKAQLIVTALSARHTSGWLRLGPLAFRCALGRSGISPRKREGDGATPAGTFVLRRCFFRSDSVVRPRTGVPARAIKTSDGWCDAPGDRNYNRFVKHPYPASAEQLWRPDHLYDVVIVLGHNDAPRIKGAGSAVFLHVARPGYAPTEGCVAVSVSGMRKLLPHLSSKRHISIWPRPRKSPERSNRPG